MSCCDTITKWGRCVQPSHQGHNYCYYHLGQMRNGSSVDDYYHKKIATGLLQPTGSYLNVSEIDTMFAGRPRNDGRRLDKYTS